MRHSRTTIAEGSGKCSTAAMGEDVAKATYSLRSADFRIAECRESHDLGNFSSLS
jgi:hypothetical protein